LIDQNVRELKRKALNRGIPLIALGIVRIFVSAFYYYVGLGKPGVGILEMSGLIIGAIITAAGLVKVLFPDTLLLLRALAGIYVTGILYVGLQPKPSRHIQHRALMDSSNFCWGDVAINTVGFIPLGYLLMLSSGNRQKGQGGNLIKRALIVAGVGILISLFLEISQYYLISGRQSSLFDWMFNTLGTLVGSAMYIFIDRK